MEQLSGLDSTFLYMESSTNYGHVGGLQIFRNAATPHWRTAEEDAANTEYLYSLATYTRRRLVEVPFGLDHPYWIEDPAFDRDFHERFIAVPSPGTDRQLEQVVSRIASRPLDRSRPLGRCTSSRAWTRAGSSPCTPRLTTAPSTAHRGHSSRW